MADLGICSACGTEGSGIAVDGFAYCDACADRALARATGWQMLPSPPPAEVLIGPDRRRHFIRYRYIRMPTAILGVAEELGPPTGSGYRVEAHCNHFGDANLLEPQLRLRVRAAVGRSQLKFRYGAWSITGDDVGGWLDEDLQEGSGLPRVRIDGRSLSWVEFGILLAPYVGWAFHLRLGGDGEAPVDHDAANRVRTRPPTTAETRAAERASRMAGGAFFLDSAHYPRPAEWASGRRGES